MDFTSVLVLIFWDHCMDEYIHLLLSVAVFVSLVLDYRFSKDEHFATLTSLSLSLIDEE